jgi:uncharacterized membrane protein
MHIGPLPAPETLAGYGIIDKSFPDRMLTMTEKNSEHRRQMDLKNLDYKMLELNYSFKEARLGQIFAITGLIFFISSGVLLLFLEKKIFGSLFSLSAFGMIVFAFLRKSSRKTKPHKGNEEVRDLDFPSREND